MGLRVEDLVIIGGRALFRGPFWCVFGAACLVLDGACFALLRLGFVEPHFLCSTCLLCGSGVGFLCLDLPLRWPEVFFYEAFLFVAGFSLWVAPLFWKMSLLSPFNCPL